MSHANLRPFIVKVSVLGYFPLVSHDSVITIIIKFIFKYKS